MTIGPVTHAGSNWRKLCRSHNLDPEEATAADVEKAILAAAVDPIMAQQLNQWRKLCRQYDLVPEQARWARLLVAIWARHAQIAAGLPLGDGSSRIQDIPVLDDPGISQIMAEMGELWDAPDPTEDADASNL